MKKHIIQFEIGECEYSILKSVMKKFKYDDESKFIRHLIHECWEYNINFPINLNGNEHQQNLDLSRLKFFK